MAISTYGVSLKYGDASATTEVIIKDPHSAGQLGKPCGVYLTMECPLLREQDPDARIAISTLLGEELARMIPQDGQSPVLVIGLGNRFITPDSLGPLTVDRTLVTRHMLSAGFAPEDMRSVCAVSPGVLGVTGVETMEMVLGLVDKVRPRAVICIDSLAARDTSRIGCAVQLSDTGIQPGAGVGNHRSPLTKETLGVDVIAVGMPTVVYAATLARDAFAALSNRDTDDASLRALERDLLNQELGEMIVTPREIDVIVKNASIVIASGLNRALHPRLNDAEIAAMMD
jgi:spore protease